MANVSSSNGLEKRPKLRFPGFDEPWKEIKIGDIFKVTRGNVLSSALVSSEKSNGYTYPVFSSQTKDDGLMGYYNEFLFEDAITWTTDGANAGTVHFRKGKFYCTNVCGVLLNSYGYANRCIAEILGRVSKRYVSYVGNPKLMNNVMSEICIYIPSLAEQSHIDDFLLVLDKKIEKQRQLVDSLKKYKRGAVRYLLSPKSCPLKNARWTTAKLGELGNFVKGAPLSKADISEDGTPFILYGELYTTYNEVVTSVKRRTQAQVDELFLSRVGDVVIPTSGETSEEISTASCVMLPGVILAGDLNIFRSDKVDGRIMSYLLNHVVNAKIARIAQGKSVVHIQASELGKLTLSYPDENTQKKLIDFLSKFDDKIVIEENALTFLTGLKEGLMQQLFI